MIPSSRCSLLEQVDSAPANSLATQQNEGDTEGLEFKQVHKEKEKQVIVNNYYISDKDNGWKQLPEGEILPNIPASRTQGKSSEISPNKTLLKDSRDHFRTKNDEKNSNNNQDRENMTQTKTEPKRYYSEEGEVQNMSPPARHMGNQETSAMLDCIHQLQLTIQQHVLTNSKQAEYHMSQNADIFTEMIKVQNRRDLDPAVMAIPTFTGQEPEKCLDWINRIKNI